MTTDILIFVGRVFYPTWQDYVYEAAEKVVPGMDEKGFGCCRRTPGLPEILKLGETQVHLVHREGPGQPALLFASYVVDGVIQCSQQQAVVDEVRNGILLTAIGGMGRDIMPHRGCGGIDPPAIYVVSPRDITVLLGLRPDTGRTGKITVIDPPLNLGDLKHFRGFKQVTWEELMAMVV